MPYIDSEKQREAERHSKRRARSGCGGEPGSRARPFVQPDAATLDGIVQAVETALTDAMNDESAGALSRGRVVAQLGMVALKAYETGVMLDRLEAVETALHIRKEARR